MTFQSSSPSVSQAVDRKAYSHGNGTDHLRTGARSQRLIPFCQGRNIAGGKAPMTSSAPGHARINPVNVKKTWPYTMDHSLFLWHLTVISDNVSGKNGFLHFDSSILCKLTIVWSVSLQCYHHSGIPYCAKLLSLQTLMIRLVCRDHTNQPNLAESSWGVNM